MRLKFDEAREQAATSSALLALQLSIHLSVKSCAAAGEEEDGFDETILPTDHKQAGQIRDTELARAIVHRLPAGVVVHALFDSCHSGAQGV